MWTVALYVATLVILFEAMWIANTLARAGTAAERGDGLDAPSLRRASAAVPAGLRYYEIVVVADDGQRLLMRKRELDSNLLYLDVVNGVVDTLVVPDRSRAIRLAPPTPAGKGFHSIPYSSTALPAGVVNFSDRACASPAGGRGEAFVGVLGLRVSS